MEIDYIESLASTHLYMVDAIKRKSLKPPRLLYVNAQYDGVGSRGNEWLGEPGNLYMSFCITKDDLPSDVPECSVAIYFACVMREALEPLGSSLWLKWPNDFYIGNRKIGGLITAKIGDVYIVSMGINILSCPQDFGLLDIKITNHELVERFCEELKFHHSWKKVFSKFRVEFQKSKDFTFHEDEKVRSLGDAILCDDGSIKINGKKVYSLR